MVHLQIHPFRKILENDLPSKPPWGHVPTLIFRVGVVSFLGSSPPTSPGPITQGRRIGPRKLPQELSLQTIGSIARRVSASLGGRQGLIPGRRVWSSSSSDKMIEVAAGQQLISDLQPFLKILQWSHALILLEHDTSMKPRPGSAASSHRDLAKPEVKRLFYLGKWMVARGSFLLGWFNLFSGANLLKKLQGGVHVMFVSWCFECFFQLFQLTLLNFKSVAWVDGSGPRRAWPTASCAKAGFSSLLGKRLGVGTFDVRCRRFLSFFLLNLDSWMANSSGIPR